MQTFPVPHACFALFAALLVACDRSAEEEPLIEMAAAVEGIDSAVVANLPPDITVEMLETGRQLYVVCSVCHGLDGSGTQLGPSLRDPPGTHGTGSREDIAAVIVSGVANPVDYPVPMPVMGGGSFDEAELEALSAYVYALGRD